jgi:hypothetical protein
MPNFDAGHYFLTVLAPVRTDSVMSGGQSRSHRDLLKATLARMPAGERTVASRGKQQDNPFARNTRNHFARFSVLDDVVFNGRTSGDALLARLTGEDPLAPQKVDRLTSPFLIFVCDFDAASGAASELRGYAALLWETMHTEIVEVFQHCVGFERVASAEAFFAYLTRCQSETTMPFNDYWQPMPALKDFSLTPYALVGGAALLLFLVPLFTGPLWVCAIGALALVSTVVVLANAIMTAGAVALPPSAPPAPVSSLPVVLKALTVQRAFTDFAIQAQTLRTQGDADAALHAAFGAFLASAKPADLAVATQQPGIIGV